MGKRNRGSIFCSSACKLLHSGFDADTFIADPKRGLSSSRPCEPWAAWFWRRARWHSMPSALTARAMVHLHFPGGAANCGKENTGCVGWRCSEAAGEVQWKC